MAKQQGPKAERIIWAKARDGAPGELRALDPVSAVQDVFDPDGDYVEVELVSYPETGSSQVSGKVMGVHSTVHSRLSSTAPNDNSIELRNLLSTSFLGEVQTSRNKRIQKGRTTILGPVPFRSDLRLELGLFSAKNEERINKTMGLLTRMAETAAAPFVEIAKPFAQMLGDGVDIVLGFDDGLRLEVGVSHAIANEGGPGVFVVLFNEAGYGVDELALDTQGRLVRTSSGEQLDEPHIVYEIVAKQGRPDWMFVPTLAQSWAEARETIRSSSDQSAVISALKRVQRLALLSPDLTPKNAQAVAGEVREKLDGLLYTFESAAQEDVMDIGPLSALSPKTHDDPEEWFESAGTSYETLSHVDYDKGFLQAMEFVFGAEGGYVDNSRDFGGATNLGVTQATYDHWLRGHEKPTRPVKLITHGEAIEIYHENYWKASACDELGDNALALVMFDTAVLFGVNKAGRMLQMALSRFVTEPLNSSSMRRLVDGDVGQKTIGLLQSARQADGDLKQVIQAVLSLRAGYHRTRVIQETHPAKHQGEFIIGWLNRVGKLHEKALGERPSETLYQSCPPLRPQALEHVDPQPRVASQVAEQPLRTSPGSVEDDFHEEFEEEDELNTATHFESAHAPKLVSSPDGENAVYSEALEAIASAGLDDEAVVKRLKALRDSREFQKLHIAALFARSNGHNTLAVRLLEARALIELGRDAIATARLQAIVGETEQNLTDASMRDSWQQAKGALGRLQKDAFVDLGDDTSPQAAELLRNAISEYEAAHIAYPDETLWHAINVVALKHRLASVIGDQAPKAEAENLAREIVAAVTTRDQERHALESQAELADEQAERLKYLQREKAWDTATLAEAYVALNMFGEAEKSYADYVQLRVSEAKAKGKTDYDTMTDFSLSASLRQLREVWQFDKKTAPEAGRRLYLNIKKSVAPLPGATVEFHASEFELLASDPEMDGPNIVEASNQILHMFEAVYGREVMPLTKWLNGLTSVVPAIARVDLNRTNKATEMLYPKGTGFLVEGRVLHEAWGDEPLFITNEHVVSKDPKRHPRPMAIKPGSAVIEFSMGDPDTRHEIEEVIWQSDRMKHDVVVCRLKTLPAGVKPLSACEFELPPLDELEGSELFEVCVIGHPSGREISFSPSNLRVTYHDYDPQTAGVGRPVRLHYRSSTEPGNSGSPVFDWLTFKLVGVHHAGVGQKYRYEMANGRVTRKYGGIERVNEAISIASIKAAINKSLGS